MKILIRILIAIFIAWNIITAHFALNSGPLWCNGNYWYHNISLLYWRLVIILGFIIICYAMAGLFI